MASQQPVEDDPLVSALPPATDYLTYLTLLEYQLTPQNLPTLSRLLSQDDGKLAVEIGWDLLKLLLPMLKDTPEEANRCLEVVARRGNPREVVVRVAEELEKLSDQAEGVGEVDFEDGDEQDELPTFPGEAPRVHLGQMTLEGMPDARKPAEASLAQHADEASTAQQISVQTLQLQALFNMLSILHPRIKTQYPSRFLATSLPAALGAYRQIPITTVTTSAFLSMLEKLAGKKRPTLPPRASTQGEATSSSGSTQGLPTMAAPLPDPGPKAEEGVTGVNIPSEEEKAIIFRLLDAVLLEILDEYMSALATHEYPSMSWTARLREHLEPKRVVLGRSTEDDMWKHTPELEERDALLARFSSISKEMRLDTSRELKKLVDEDEDEHSKDAPGEYPTSPSQIPFPRAGVIYLHACHSYLDPSDTATLLTATELTKLIARSFPLSATPSIPLPALQDSLLSLLYKQTLSVAAAPTTPQPSPEKFLLLISTLTQLFTITPYPALRDSAHYIATRLLHAYPDPSVRIRIVTQTLEGNTLSTNWVEIEDDEGGTEQPPASEIVEETGLARSTSALIPHPIPLAPPQQLSQLKAIGVDWLKDEFSTWIAAKLHKSGEGTVQTVIGALDPAEVLLPAEEAVGGEEKDKDVDAPSLLDLLFPPEFPVLPTTTASSSSATQEQDTSDTDLIAEFLLSIPLYISTLNLTCIVLPHLQRELASSSTGTPVSSSGVTGLKSRIWGHMDALSEWSKVLVEILQHAQASSSTAEGDHEEAVGLRGGGEGEGFLGESRADIFALEDACARAREAWEKVGKE